MAQGETSSDARQLDSAAFTGLAEFRLALRQFLAFGEATTSANGVTSQQYQAMLVIKASGQQPVSIKQLAEQMLVAHNGAVQMVDRLVESGLVERSAAPGDRRRVLIGLSRRGDALVNRLAATMLPELRKHKPLLARSLQLLEDI